MTNVYAQPGSSFQQIGGACPAGWVEMSGPRPEPDYIAQADGMWVKLTRVPKSCTRRQGRLALLEVGKLDDVEAYIEAIEDPMTKRQAQIEYEADTWERDNELLQQLWAALGGTETELDDLFILAATR